MTGDTALLEKLVERVQRRRQVNHQALPRPETIDTVIVDGTSALQRVVQVDCSKARRKPKDTEAMDVDGGGDAADGGGDDDPPYFRTSAEAGYVADLDRTFNYMCIRNAKNYVVVYDNPTHVTRNKNLEQEHRDQVAPYTSSELEALGCKDPGKAFAVDSIWGSRKRLWASAWGRVQLNTFFCRAYRTALERMRLETGGEPCRFIIDPPDEDAGIWRGYIGSQLETTRVALAESSQNGESDVKFLDYLVPAYGSRIAVRSEDCDWFWGILGYLDRCTLLQPDGPLPDILLDRTVAHSVQKSTRDTTLRIVDMTSLYMELREFAHPTPSHPSNNRESRHGYDRSGFILSIVAMCMFGKTDYVAKFCQLGQPTSSVMIYGPEAMFVTKEEKARKAAAKNKGSDDGDKAAVTKKRKRSDTRNTHLFDLPEFVQCFGLEVDDRNMVRPAINHIHLRVILKGRYPSAKAIPPNLDDALRLELLHLEWALRYVYQYHEPLHGLPRALECVQRVAGVPRWGWKLVPVFGDALANATYDRKVVQIAADHPHRATILAPVFARDPSLIYFTVRLASAQDCPP
jgi:hypothetical protein